MKARALPFVAGVMLFFFCSTEAATVEPTGYTNDFSTLPSAADWATASRTGSSPDAYDSDADVNATIALTDTTMQVGASTNDPPAQGGGATWSSSGLYVQTRPTLNRYTVLLASFVNNTGTNASEIAWSYDFRIAAGGPAEDAGKGNRFYYSLTGLPGRWTNVPALNTTAFTNSTWLVSHTLAIEWTNGAPLYLLWVDDNCLPGTDAANQIDNFSLRVTAGLSISTLLASRLTVPTNGALFASDAPVQAAAAVWLGTQPYRVEYFTNGGAGNRTFVSAGSSATAPFDVSFGTFGPGVYNIYGLVTDSGDPVLSTTTITNEFSVTDLIFISLTSPLPSAHIDHLMPVTAVATASGGTPPYAVQFYLDDVAQGPLITSPPYEHDFGLLFVGDYTVRVSATDARGWTSNSLAHSIRVTGPLATTLSPTNGETFYTGEQIVLNARVGGGTGPYTVTFYTNDQPAAVLNSAPFAFDLGMLPFGSYTSYVHVSDSSVPPAEVWSTTNTFTVEPSYLFVFLWEPENGAMAVEGVPMDVNAAAYVQPPLTIDRIEFFYNGELAGVATNTPYSAIVTNHVRGSGTIYAAVVDSSGRTGYSETNRIEVLAGGIPPNDNFNNAIPLSGPGASVIGNNFLATRQVGDPFIAGNPGGASVWWTWTPSTSGPATIDTFDSDFDTLLGVYTGSVLGQLAVVAQNDDSQGVQSRVQFNASSGTVYRVVVDGYGFGSGPDRGVIRLNIRGAGGMRIDSPTNNAIFTVGDPIQVDVSILPDFPNPPPSRIEFYFDDQLVTSVSNAPFTGIITNAPPGSNTLQVVAVDSLGGRLSSQVLRIYVQEIGVTILTPQNFTTFFDTAAISITAWAYVPDGVITNVEFFVDDLIIREDAAFPFGAVWTNVVAGSHRITARAHASNGQSYESDPVNIGVAGILAPYASTWRYLDNGSDPGTNWAQLDFDDTTWALGRAPLGYGDSQGRLPATVVSSGLPGSRHATTYFRQSVLITNVESLSWLEVNIERDDGAVVYVNGVEVRRYNMPTGPVTYTTYASLTASDDGGFPFFIFLFPEDFREGTNVLAVEIHQDLPTGTDLWFQMELVGVPQILQNLRPIVSLISPTNHQAFLAPTNIILEAEAADPDGVITRVEFFVDGVPLGETTNAPYAFNWNAPTVGAHVITAAAMDDFGDLRVSQEALVLVYDAFGTPIVEITNPASGAVMQGPTNLLVAAAAYAIPGLTNVQFLANGTGFANDDAPPYSAIWNSPFGTNLLTAIATDANGLSGTSAAVTVTITIPPTNVIAPVIISQSPAGSFSVTSLTSVVVTFSEYVQNIDASDLLINGLPAAMVDANHSRSNYTFTFPQPAYGPVNIAWAEDHGITDYGWPTVLHFDATGTGATWSYTLLDRTPPIITARTPAPGSTVTNLAQIAVTFSEPVSGVDAADLRVNGTPALEVTGAGASYTFRVAQPPMGTVAVTWATDHAIFDLADTPNAFNRTAPGAAWNFLLDTRAVLVRSNSVWRFVKGTNEASVPMDAWRQLAFDDSGWSNSPAPFFFGDPYGSSENPGTVLSDMYTNYTTVYLRTEFTVADPGSITNLWLNAQNDDGFIAWINGVEVRRYNAPAGDPVYNALSGGIGPEPQGRGAAFIQVTLGNAVEALVEGRNILAVQGFNQALFSSDFGFNAELYTITPDPATIPPRIRSSAPAPGEVLELTNVTIRFSEPISGVDAADFLVNGVPAETMSTATNTTYSFSFPQPSFGPVTVSWDPNHGIADFDDPPKPFGGQALAYSLINPSSPRIVTQVPAAGAAVNGLTSLTVTFSEPVSGIQAGDLLVSGAPALSVTTDDDTTFRFSFTQPPYGSVTIRWAMNHGIVDIEGGHVFDATRPEAQWNYTLIDPAPSVTLTTPTNNAYRLAPAFVALAAAATDSDGTVARVEFYEGANLLGESVNTPYSLTWSNVAVGTYLLRAVAIDDIGLRGTSAPVVLNVVTSLPAVLVRGPYLQIGTPTSGVVRWRTDVPGDGIVFYGTDPESLTNSASQAAVTNEHIVPITGLEPDTKYYYSIGSSAQRLAGTNGLGSDFWFITSPMVGVRKPTRIWVLGDAGTAGNGLPTRQASTRDAFYNFAAGSREPDLWLMLGDNAYNSGTDSEYQRAVFNMYPTTLRNRFLWPTLGNHETAQSTTVIDFPYLHIFSLPQGGEAGGIPSGSEKYYSFDYANIHFVCLDSMTSGRTATTAMANWLQADLAAATAEWIIVFFHHPPYTKGSHNSDIESDLVAIRENLVPIMEANGVDLVLSGHSHCWERSYLIDGHYGPSTTFTESMKVNPGDGQEGGDGPYTKNADGRGVVYTVAGSSGQASGGALNHPAHFRSLNELGSMVIDVEGNRLTGMFLHANGEIQDQFTLLKPDQPPAAPIQLVATPVAAAEVRLDWLDAATNELGYSIERSLDGLSFTQVLTAGADASSVSDHGVLENTTYYYRVRGTNATDVSDYSNVASLTTVSATGPPEAPTGLVAASEDGLSFYRSQMLLSWEDKSSNEAGFLVERSPDGLLFAPITTLAANTTSYRDTGLESAMLYFYRLRAFNVQGQSSPTEIASDQTHPKSQTVRFGETVTFHAGVEGAPLARYQWRFNGDTISGATNETFTITNATLIHQGEYSVLIQTESALISNPAMLIVVSAPRIVADLDDVTVSAGMAAVFSIIVEGTPPFTYQWRRNNNPIGINGPALSIADTRFSDQGEYQVIVENDYGSVTSRLARLAVYSAPGLMPVPDLYAEVLKPLIFTNTAIDLNVPPLDLRFSLGPGAPTNAYVHPVSGVFRWIPNRVQAPGTNLITLRITDATRPTLSGATAFTVYVNHYAELRIGSLVMLAGTNGTVPITLFSSAELAEFECELNFAADRFDSISLEEALAASATATLEWRDPDRAALRFVAAPGNVLHGTLPVAQLRLSTEAGASPEFIWLRPSSPVATMAGAAAMPTLLATEGRVTIVGTRALLEANARRQVTLYGRPGVTYTLEYSTNNMVPGSWQSRGIVTLTNLVRVITVGDRPSTNVTAVFRARH